MTPEPFRIPGDVFDAMAAGGGGAAGLRLLARAEHSRRLACVHAVTAAARDVGGSVAREAQEAWEVLAAARRRAPEETAAVLTHPSAGPMLIGLLIRLDHVRDPTRTAGLPGSRHPSAVRPGIQVPWPQPVFGPTDVPMYWFTALAAAAAIRAGLPGRVRWTATGPWTVLPSLGRVHFPGAVRGGTVEAHVTGPGRAVIAMPGDPRAPGPVTVPADPHHALGRWQGARVLTVLDTEAPLLLDVLDPPCFPGATGGPAGLGAGEVRHWADTARIAARLLRTDHPRMYAELAAGPRVLVPLAGTGRGSVSGSSAESFGCVALSRPRSAAGLGVTLAHEMQHNKFAALLHLFDLFEADGQELYYASWRPDPRPLAGLFHGAYAHLSVAQFWNRRRETDPDPARRAAAHVQFARWRTASHEATHQLLGSARLTPLGRRFAGRMLDTLDVLCRLPVPAAARRQASASARAHRSEWSERNGRAAAMPA